MVKINQSKNGFTLIEIIVVLVIVGILSAISLPNLYNNVAKQRSQEALASIASFRPIVEGCIVREAGTSDSSCNSANLGLPLGTTNFSYSIAGPTSTTDTSYIITANGGLAGSALSSSDTIVMSRAASSWPGVGTVSCVGTGQLVGAC